MTKTILITGATDGIGLALAKKLASQSHHLLIHGRSPEKLKVVHEQISAINKEASNSGSVHSYLADLSVQTEVTRLANEIKEEHSSLDVLLNNAGIFKTNNPISQDGLDVRFSVNTIAPYILTQLLMPILGKSSRVINLSSAAQAPLDIEALEGKKRLADMDAYSQSKLAITMWTAMLAEKYKNNGPSFVAVNPGSLLASNMVQQGFGIDGNDISIGVNILLRMALEEELEAHSGQYFDNDIGEYSTCHPDGLNMQKKEKLMEALEFIKLTVLN
jgi:NAD(P)-dependent dehydrogenase (short-subunit alcohol dehydrogenase family)